MFACTDQDLCEAAAGLLKEIEVKGMAHITGGGFIENIPRMSPDGVNVDIEYGSWPILPIFKLMQEKAHIEQGYVYDI